MSACKLPEAWGEANTNKSSPGTIKHVLHKSFGHSIVLWHSRLALFSNDFELAKSSFDLSRPIGVESLNLAITLVMPNCCHSRLSTLVCHGVRGLESRESVHDDKHALAPVDPKHIILG